MARASLTPDQKRLRMIVLSLPLAVASGFVLYKRLYLGEEQRHLKPGDRLATRPASTARISPASEPAPAPAPAPASASL